MTRNLKSLLLVASFFLASAVLLGAFAAHGLQYQLSAAQLATFQTAVDYQFIHGLGLLLLGTLGATLLRQERWWKAACYLMIVGVLLFSGSLYVYVLFAVKSVVWITPIGGVAFVAAWLSLFLCVLTQLKSQ